MKKILIFFLIVLFSGCSLQDKFCKKCEECECKKCNCEEEKISKDELFKKNQECYKYKKDIEERIVSENNEKEDERFTYSLESIFYSPEANSCLYIKVRELNSSYGKDLYDVMSDNYHSKILDQCFCFRDTEKDPFPLFCEDNSCEEFDERIKNKWKK